MKDPADKSKSATRPKRVYEYDDYREFLRDYYLATKSHDKKFSFRFFARVAGLASPSSLKRVIEGERNLTAEGIEKFSKALKLNKEESGFFAKLVLFNQAKDTEVRQKLGRELMRYRGYKRLHPLNEAQFNCLANWYFLPIREMVNLPDFRDEPEWIADRLSPKIKPHEAKRALEDLMNLGLIERNAQGRLVQTNADITAGDEVIRSGVGHYHRELLKLAGESIDRQPRQRRDISAMTLGLSHEDAAQIKEMIQNFRKEIVAKLAEKETSPDSVYQLNIQLFAVTAISEKDIP